MQNPGSNALNRTLYRRLIGQPSQDQLESLAPEARQVIPGNFVRLMLSYFLTKLGDAVISPKTTLVFAMNAVAAPSALVSLLVPIRESGALLPQVILAGLFEPYRQRKWLWVAGSIGQALFIGAIGLVTWQLSGSLAGVAILLLLGGFSLARAVCSVTSKDVIGKTIPKQQRGRTTGYSASLAGLITIGVGLFLGFGERELTPTRFALLLAAGASLWLLAAWLYGRVREPDTRFDGQDHGAHGDQGFLDLLLSSTAKLKLVFTDPPFRRFLLVRALLISSALLGPYLVLLSRERSAAALSDLGFFIIAGGVASLISSPLWGKLADLSSRRVLIVTGFATSTLTAAVIGLEWSEWSGRETWWLYPLAFFLLSIIHDGVRLGRSTYVVDMAQGQQRTDYVAVSNTAIGIILLVAGLVTAALSAWSILAVLLVLGSAALAAALMGFRLQEVQKLDTTV